MGKKKPIGDEGESRVINQYEMDYITNQLKLAAMAEARKELVKDSAELLKMIKALRKPLPLFD
jgi:hypothetical protein